MGSENGNDDERPIHRVRITQPFEIGKYEVTQREWQTVMGTNPSSFKGAERPVENVSWEDCQRFIARLNQRGDGYCYRLPTEAEWEYACRAGSSGDYAGNLDEMGWYASSAGSKTHNIGQKKPNAWGLHDMHGNVWEWCQDWYGRYPSEATTDPAGSNRVVRGGGWRNSAENCRASARFQGAPSAHGYNLGFRLVRLRL
jgi:formylglycine-generating enzyme required for sulfatase activity